MKIFAEALSAYLTFSQGQVWPPVAYVRKIAACFKKIVASLKKIPLIESALEVSFVGKLNHIIFAIICAVGLAYCAHPLESSQKTSVEKNDSKTSEAITASSITKEDLSTPDLNQSVSPDEVSAAQSHWFKGSFLEALKKAAKSKKQVFVYWGAEWCPPCNALKDQVFSHPEFPTLMKNYVAVYIDGDAASAQALGQSLNVSGYPTMLLLSPRGKELFRLDAGYDFAEFKEALLVKSGTITSLKTILGKLGKKKLSRSEWKSLMTSSIDSEQLGLTPEKTEELIINLWKLCPSEYIEAKSIFAVNLWGSIGEDTAKLKSTFKDNEVEMIEQVFASGMTMDAARAQLMSNTKDKILLLKSENKERVRHHLATYLKGISEDSERSPSERASAIVSVIELEKMSTRLNLSKLISDTQIVVDSILSGCRSSHEKSATYPEIAVAYHELYGSEKAASFLESKIPEVKSPWYLESMLANLESEQNHKDKALMWSERATISSKGTATRLQWLSKDIVLKGKFLQPGDKKLSDAIRIFFNESAKTTDAFKGRNEASQKRVAEVVKKIGIDNVDLISEANKLCGSDDVCKKIYEIR